MTSTGTKAILVLVIGLGAVLRCVGLDRAGAIYSDDLRAYSGLTIRDTLFSRAPLNSKLHSAYEVSISETGARPSLAWLMTAAAAVGADSIGELYFPIAVLGVGTLLAVALLATRVGDPLAGTVAAGWLAVSSAHLAYSRSALTVVPGSLAFVIGLLLCTDRGGALAASKARWIWAGVAWAVMLSFHPAYVVYLSVPLVLLALPVFGGRVRPKNAALLAIASITPAVVLPLLYDTPAALHALATGRLELADLRYLSALGALGTSSTIRGSHEGLTFFPRFFFEAEGVIAVFLVLFAVVGLARVRGVRVFVGVWIVVPLLLWAIAPGIRTYGRLFGPTLPGIAVLLGVGVSQLVARHPRSTVILLVCGAVVLANGLFRAGRLRSAEGFEPSLARQLTADQESEAVGLVRSDVHSLPWLGKTALSYDPVDVRRAICNDGKRFLILSPGSFYLVIRHWRFFTEDLELAPVTVFNNPYKSAFRLMDGSTPRERALVLQSPLMTRLGLFRVVRLDACAVTRACC